jgi:aminoglycoside phosphotransferase (APT) family kinase protein
VTEEAIPQRSMTDTRRALLEATATSPRDHAKTGRILEEWLRTRLGAFNVSIGEFTTPLGAGVSHETLLFPVRWDEGSVSCDGHFVLRIKPTTVRLFPNDNFSDQFKLMQFLTDRGTVTAPALWLEEDPSLLGSPFMIMRRLEGRVPVSSPSYNAVGWLYEANPQQRRNLWESAVTQLGRIHSVPLQELRFLKSGESRDSRNAHQLNYWDDYLAWCVGSTAEPAMLRTRSWLEKNRPAGDEGLSWGDARIGNMMFDFDFTLAGVMDWEQFSLDGPCHDLGWWLFFDRFHSIVQGIPRLDGLGTRAETIALWQSVTGRVAHDLEWYEAFAAYKVALLTLRTMQVGGLSEEDSMRTAVAMVHFAGPGSDDSPDTDDH